PVQSSCPSADLARFWLCGEIGTSAAGVPGRFRPHTLETPQSRRISGPSVVDRRPRQMVSFRRLAARIIEERSPMSTVAVQPAAPGIRRIDSRAVIIGLVIAVICSIFWLGSRYPSLQSKAGADPDESLSTPLGFESHWKEPRADQKLERILWVAAEWG